MGIVCGLVSWGYWCVCVCVAVSSWVCRSNVSRFVLLVRSGVWGLVPRCMYQSGWGFFLRVGALGVTWVGYCCWRTGQYRGWVALIQFFLSPHVSNILCLSSGRTFVQVGFLIVCFSHIYVSSLAGGKKTWMYVQVVFLMINTRCQKHEEDPEELN